MIDGYFAQFFMSLLQEIVANQRESNELLSRIAHQLEKSDQSHLLKAWKNANPQLSKECKVAADQLGEVRQQLIKDIVEDIENVDGDTSYMLGELVDRNGQKLFHVNNMLQVLSSLGSS